MRRPLKGRLGPPSWASILRSLGLLAHPSVTVPAVLGPVVVTLAPYAFHPTEDLEELEEGWELSALRRAYGDASERATEAYGRMAALVAPEPDMPALRRPRPRDAPSVDTGQFSKRKDPKK